MFDVLSITGPIYIAIALGYAVTRAGLFDKTDMRTFGKFVISIALPALVFRTLATRHIAEVLDPTYFLAYCGGSLLTFAGAFFLYRRLGLPDIASTFRAMGMSCSNSGFVGYPIALLTIGPVAGVGLSLNMVVENLVMIPLLLTLAERGRGAGGPWYRAALDSLRRLATNPLILAMAAGLLVSVAGWSLPAPALRAVDLFAGASAGISLFVIGGNLVGLPLKGLGRRVAPIAFGKLVVMPTAVALVLALLVWAGLPPLSPELKSAAILMAAMPMMSIYPMLAQAYGQEDVAAPALLVTTLASFFTLSCLLWVMRHF